MNYKYICSRIPIWYLFTPTDGVLSEHACAEHTWKWNMEQYIMYMYIMYTEQYSICYNQNNED